MDWAAQMLGLDAAFYNASEIGGGVIQVIVCISFLPVLLHSHRVLCVSIDDRI